MISVNLIPEDLLQARRRSCRLRRWAVAVLATAAAVCAAGGIEWYRRVEAAELRTLQQQVHGELDAVRTEVQTLTAKTQKIRHHVERAAALRSKRAWSGLFAVVGSCMPEPCWLISLATDPAVPGSGVRRPNPKARRGVAEPEGSTIKIDAPRKLRLIGYAPDAADPHVFVTNLKRTNLFTGVRLERLQREAALDASYFRFELVCEW